MRQHKLWLCTLLVLLLAALGAFGAAAETTVGMSGAGSQDGAGLCQCAGLDVYFYAFNRNSKFLLTHQGAGGRPGADAWRP